MSSTETMTAKEAILDHANVALKLAAYQHAKILKFEDFCEGLVEDYQVDLTKSANEDGYQNAHDYLRSLGFELNNDGDFIVPETEISTNTAKFIGAKQVQNRKAEMKKYYKQHPQPFVLLENYKPPVAPAPAVGNDDGGVQPVRPVREVFIYDGDETKLMPGMRVKISSGTIYELPAIPDNPKLQKKACTKFRQKVRDLVEKDAKYKALIAMMNNGRKE